MRTGYVFSAVLLTLVTLPLIAVAWFGYAMSMTYFKNMSMGIIGIRFMPVLFALAALNLVWAYSRAPKKIGRPVDHWIALVVISVSPYLTTYFPINHYFTYFIGEVEYLVPWQYDPQGDGHEPGGGRININALYPELLGQYDSTGEYSTRGMVISLYNLNRKLEGTPLDTICDESGCKQIPLCHDCDYEDAKDTNNRRFYFIEDGLQYRFGYRHDPISFSGADELAAFKGSIVDLFDSFRVHE